MSDGWGDAIGRVREDELVALLAEWEREDPTSRPAGPFVGQSLTGADAFWLIEHGHVDLREARLTQANLENADLFEVDFRGARLDGAYLVRAKLVRAQLQRAGLQRANLKGALLSDAQLERADLRVAMFDRLSGLQGARLNHAFLDGTIFDGTDLTTVNWSEVRRLGDDLTASGAAGYYAAARTYRRLSLSLRAQGLVKDAARFHYQAEVMDRSAFPLDGRERCVVAWRQCFEGAGPTAPQKLLGIGAVFRRWREFLGAAGLYVRWPISLSLGTVAGYGVYHIWRLFVTYLLLVGVFAGLYYVVAPHAFTKNGWVDPVVLSVTSFHGRGLQPSTGLNDKMRLLAGGEAVIGLLTEALFIAAFTRRVTRG